MPAGTEGEQCPLRSAQQVEHSACALRPDETRRIGRAITGAQTLAGRTHLARQAGVSISQAELQRLIVMSSQLRGMLSDDCTSPSTQRWLEFEAAGVIQQRSAKIRQ